MWLMEQRLLLEINKPISRKESKTKQKNLCSWKPQSGEKFGQTLAHRELEAKLQKQVSWVERPKPAIASSLSPSEGQDGDECGLYFLYTGPWGFRAGDNFHIFHVNPKNETFSSQKARLMGWLPNGKCVFQWHFQRAASILDSTLYIGLDSQEEYSLNKLTFLNYAPFITQITWSRAVSRSVIQKRWSI